MKNTLMAAMAFLTTTGVLGQNVYPASGYVALGTAASPTQLGVVMPVISAGNNYSSYFTDGVNTTLALRSLGDGKMYLSSDAAGRGLVLGGGYFEQTLSLAEGGKVGIGTLSPQARLDIAGQVRIADGSQLNNRVLTCDNNGVATWKDLPSGPGNGTGSSQWLASGQNISYSLGNVGIGTASPAFLSTVSQDISMNADVNVAQFGITGGSNGNKRLVLGYDTNGDGFGFIKAGNYNVTWTNLALQPNGGKVGIGTTNPGIYELAVEGTVGARKVVVTNQPWADYVFDPAYQLPPLGSVEAFIKENRHLPGVPSAKQVADDGVDLGGNQAALLKKVEELTLYMIRMEKENKLLVERVQKLELAKKELP